MKLVAAAILMAAAAVPANADPEATLDMTDFFTGRTHADNIIKIALHSPHKLIVDSVGGRNKEGEFILIDNVQEEGKPARKRTWAMRPVGPNHFTGSLSDAVGPVSIDVAGNSATIRYVMRDGNMKIEQRLTLQANGTLSNEVTARKFGLKFATVQGTIRKQD
jgi:hypothetical protein